MLFTDPWEHTNVTYSRNAVKVTLNKTIWQMHQSKTVAIEKLTILKLECTGGANNTYFSLT